MGSITLSLYWGRIPQEGWSDMEDAVDSVGNVINHSLAMGWNVKLCGLSKSERKSFVRILEDEEMYLENHKENNMINWFIKREQYDAQEERGHIRVDESQAAKHNKADAPMEFMTKYMSKLKLFGYKIVTAPSVVKPDQTSVWTLSKPEIRIGPLY